MKNENNKIQKAIYNSEELVEWGGNLNEFLWICAGADRKVLRQCPTDYAKYAGIGGTILFTALMAMLSGTYFFFLVFDNEWIACAFGIVWGLLIFCLNRFLLNTMYSDGKPYVTYREVYCGLPRIIIAIFIGIAISIPLELKTFEGEINIKIEEMIEERVDNYTTNIQNNKKLLKDNLYIENRRFQAKMLAFNEMKHEDGFTNISSWFLTIFFVIIETSPVFFKLMTASGPYDDLLRKEIH